MKKWPVGVKFGARPSKDELHSAIIKAFFLFTENTGRLPVY